MNSLENRSHKIILEGLEALCRIFWGPDRDQCGMLLQGNLISVFETLDQLFHIQIHDSLNKLNSMVKRFDDPESLFMALNEEYVRFFISHKDGITAPLYESCYEYENAPLMGAPAVRIKSLLDSAGLTLSEHFHEPPDHLCVELEYLYFILEQAWHGDKNGRYIEACDFVSQVMLPWVDIFYHKLSAGRPDSFYTLSASILCKLLRLIRDFLSTPLLNRQI